MRMSHDQIFQKVCLIFQDHMGIVGIDSLHLDTNFVVDFDLDSLDQIEMVIAIENMFQIEIDDEEMYGVKTINDAVNLIATHISDEFVFPD